MESDWIKRILQLSVLVILGVLVTVICILPLITGIVMLFSVDKEVLERNGGERPLNRDIVKDLCQRFQLPLDDLRCQPGSTTYAKDFAKVVISAFNPSDENQMTYDQIEEKFGRYKQWCEPATKLADGTEYFVCRYDLVGDGADPILIYYYLDKRVWKVQARIRD